MKTSVLCPRKPCSQGQGLSFLLLWRSWGHMANGAYFRHALFQPGWVDVIAEGLPGSMIRDGIESDDCGKKKKKKKKTVKLVWKC